jgi:hypothetical protein
VGSMNKSFKIASFSVPRRGRDGSSGKSSLTQPFLATTSKLSATEPVQTRKPQRSLPDSQRRATSQPMDVIVQGKLEQIQQLLQQFQLVISKITSVPFFVVSKGRPYDGLEELHQCVQGTWRPIRLWQRDA